MKDDAITHLSDQLLALQLGSRTLREDSTFYNENINSKQLVIKNKNLMLSAGRYLS
jgi:hypothetical protein